MIRTQVHLTPQQYAALKGLSKVENVTMAALIRKAVDLITGSSPISNRELRKQRALTVVGKFSSGSSDISIRHDKYLADLHDQ